MEERFWDLAGELVGSSEVVIDRPRGSAHPKWGHIVYPLDYGYLARTTAMDGGGIDVWVGSLAERRITGMLILRP